jgi:hypothetical protein
VRARWRAAPGPLTPPPTLRLPLHARIGAFSVQTLQLQDTTSQQLLQASAVLAEMENRLLEVAKLFDDQIDHVEGPMDAADDAARRWSHVTGSPDVTPRRAEARQARSDEIFAAVKAPAA